ncbi:methyl-accepting chemotaxis protein [Liquorilactobacillus hordei]|uniref:methyl-accepting chemotaxis protein n=1 Tax=Liquorilactobacillus hordei TaxID=468911 RepID=UPI001CBAB417|nr:methyl-accepting chemotaxis protein [Liquorilactobacillus hordei]MBZ2405888.1 hypothetical protein [Liquorilactobacillus hordei]
MFNFWKKNHNTLVAPSILNDRDVSDRQATEKATTTSAIYRLSVQIKKHFDNLLEQEGTMTYGLKDLNTGNLDTVNGIETISNNITSLSDQNDNLATKIDQMAKQLQVTNHHIEDSTSTFNATTENISQLTTNLQAFSDTISSLRIEFNQIAGKVTNINELAENTSLLALNASIEASKAGQAGRGFAVVAKETNSLSEDTKFFSKEILNSMNNLNNLVKELENQVKQSTSASNKTNEMVEQSKKDISGISTAEKIVATKMREVLTIQSHNSNTLDEITSHIDHIVTRSKDEHDNLQNLINNVDDKANNYQNISNNLEQLRRITQKKDL